jgi:hypothetical protein
VQALVFVLVEARLLFAYDACLRRSESRFDDRVQMIDEVTIEASASAECCYHCVCLNALMPFRVRSG